MIEDKTELAAIESTLRKHGEKVRLAPAIAEERFGWAPHSVSRLLVLPSGSTPRRRVQAHAALLGRVYPVRDDALRTWLRGPHGRGDGVWFLAVADPSAKATVRRVRCRA